MTYAHGSSHTAPDTTRVASSDGTPIACRTIGHGPGLIVLPGAFGLAHHFEGLARALADRLTVHLVGRRGRGGSGDRNDAYSIERECEDVAAIQQATEATLLFGHSFGGLVALEAARRLPVFRKVAVYEPGVSIDGSVRVDWVDRCRAELTAGRGLDAFVTFVRGINPETTGRVPHRLLKLILLLAMRPDDREEKYRLLPTAIREHLEAARLDGTYESYADIAGDVLLLAGAKGPTAALSERTLSRLAQALPDPKPIVFGKLDHFGPEKRPHEIAGPLVDFFLCRPPESGHAAGSGARPTTAVHRERSVSGIS